MLELFRVRRKISTTRMLLQEIIIIKYLQIFPEQIKKGTSLNL